MTGKTAEAVRPVMAELFRKYGIPRAIHSDNGTPFAATNGILGLTTLSAWWITLGILPERSLPGCPGQNGSLERMHADIAREIEGKIPGGIAANQIALHAWVEEYNAVRPNEAIGMLTPDEVYRPSERKYVGDFDVLEYPAGFTPRKVFKSGEIILDGARVTIGASLKGWHVGLRPQKESGLYDDGVPLCDLINTTFDLDGVDRYKFIANFEELGRMVVDGEIDERFSDLSDDILELIDCKKVGLDQMRKDKGIFYEGSYYTTVGYEIPKVHTSVTQADKLYSAPQAAFRLQISGRTKIGKYAGIKRELSLPVDHDEADRMAQECGENRIEDCHVVHTETAIPQIRLQTYRGFEDFAKLNAIAKAFMSMSEHQRMTFKAVLQNEQPRTLDDVIDRARNIDAYELETSACAEPDFYKLYLLHHLETRVDPKWLDGIAAGDEEQHLLRQLKAAVTDYGVVSSENQPLYRIVPYDCQDEDEEFQQDNSEDQKMIIGGI